MVISKIDESYIPRLAEVVVGLDLIDIVLDPGEKVNKLEIIARIWNTSPEEIKSALEELELEAPGLRDRGSVIDYLVEQNLIDYDSNEFYSRP